MDTLDFLAVYNQFRQLPMCVSTAASLGFRFMYDAMLREQLLAQAK